MVTGVKILDLFCCSGGAAMGYHRAGFEVTGVDIKKRPRYPFEFIQADALDFLATADLSSYDAIHASPPCQRFSPATPDKSKHPDLIQPVLDALEATGKPYIVENVPQAPLRRDLVLCGTQFNLTATSDEGIPLKLIRHRVFQSNLPLESPATCHHDRSIQTASVYGNGGSVLRTGHRYKPSLPVARRLMGIDWMPQAELSESIPPAYTEFIGYQVMRKLADA